MVKFAVEREVVALAVDAVSSIKLRGKLFLSPARDARRPGHQVAVSVPVRTARDHGGRSRAADRVDRNRPAARGTVSAIIGQGAAAEPVLSRAMPL